MNLLLDVQESWCFFHLEHSTTNFLSVKKKNFLNVFFFLKTRFNLLMHAYVSSVSISRELMNWFWHVEAGAEEEKDNLWGKTQEEVWNARRLWMGRGIMGIVHRRLSLLVAWRLGLQPLSLRLNAILPLFLGGSQNLSLLLVIIFEFFSFLFFFTICQNFMVWFIYPHL